MPSNSPTRAAENAAVALDAANRQLRYKDERELPLSLRDIPLREGDIVGRRKTQSLLL